MKSSEKKHYTQMNSNERDTVLNFAKKIPHQEWLFHPYVDGRLKDRGGTKKFILDTLMNGELIEFHLKDNKSRILLRGTEPVSPVCNEVPCVVFELKTKKVITVFWNKEDDTHRTLNMNNYDETFNVIKHFLESD